jgi:6,7-dimethyl-8-ribityllumazine synthase
VLTTDTAEQAVERAGGVSGEGVEGPRAEDKGLPGAEAATAEHGNAGYNAGDAAVEMANLLRRLEA